MKWIRCSQYDGLAGLKVEISKEVYEGIANGNIRENLIREKLKDLPERL